MRRISSLQFRAPWTLTLSKLPTECSLRLELFASSPFRLRTGSKSVGIAFIG